MKKDYVKSLITLLLVFSTTMIFAVTAPVTVNVSDCQGNSIAAFYKVFKGPNYVGQFNAGATVQLEVGQTYKLFAHYDGTSTDRETFVVSASGNTFNFNTTTVQINWSGNYLDYRGTNSWTSFGKTNGVWNARELFPNDFYGNTMKIHFGYVWNDPRSQIVVMDYEGECSINKTVSLLKVTDHNGNPIAGGTARGGYSTPTSWHVLGSTDANGFLLDIRNGSNNNLSYEMKINNTIAVVAQQTGSFYDFQTQQITMRLEKCDGTSLAGGHIRWGHGTYFGSYHFVGGNTGTNGESYAEFFPGTYSFEMGLSGTTDSKLSWNFPGNGSTVTFKTTNVTLNYSGAISFGGSTGNSRWFIKPSMELMPGGTYNFNFRPNNVVAITIPGCSNSPFVMNAAIMRLIDSQGNGLAGAVGKYYKSGWKLAGTTDANGSIFMLSSTLSGNIPFRMYWKGGSQLKTQNITTNSTIVFQTELATAQLNNSGGNDLLASFKYYASGWKTFGTGNLTTLASMELLPINYPFRVYYVGASVLKSQDISIDKDVVFVTESVTAELNDHSGADLNATFKYYASGWKTFGTGNQTTLASMELLPINYPFRVYYVGASVLKSQDISIDKDVVFATELVTAELNDHSGADLNATFKYYASGWKIFGNGTATSLASMELLPVKYPFRVYYVGASLQKSQDVGIDNSVDFATVEVTTNLTDCDGVDLSADFKYYASGWKFFGTGTNVTKELLPVKYPFNVYFGGASKQISQDVSSNVNVDFSATNVTINYPGKVTYYASGWKVFKIAGVASVTKPMLAKTYPFRYYYGNTSMLVNQVISGCDDAGFDINPNLVRLVDSQGNGLAGGTIKWYNSGWHNATGTTSNDGYLMFFSSSVPTSLSMWYRGGYEQYNGTQNMTSPILWQTVNVTGELLDANGSQVNSTMKFYALSWQNLDLNNPTGTSFSSELLGKTYSFQFWYNGTYTPVFTQNIVTNSHVVYTLAGSAPSKRDVSDNEVVVNEIKTGVYPNPFSETATFTFELKETTNVKIVIYDLSGKIIKIVANGEFSQGSNQIQWYGNTDSDAPAAAGVYFYRIEAGNSITTNRIILTR